MKKILWNEFFERLDRLEYSLAGETVYGVPKGGMIAAGYLKKARVTHEPLAANVILDDILDSGATRKWYKTKYPHARFCVIVDKLTEGIQDWVMMPWETDHPTGNDSVQENVVRMLQYIGEDPARPGLVETPHRVVRSWDELFSGYQVDIPSLFKIFDEGHDEMVILKNIRLISMCEHHILPFVGTATVGYLPGGGRILGLSKIARVVSAYARRLQVQERLTREIAEAIQTSDLAPTGVGVVIRARHSCMALRGIQDGESEMVTSCLLGTFRTSSDARAEFLRLI